MGNDTHSVVYFVNEAYGVVIRVNGATGEAAMWEREKEMFSRRIDARLAAFLQDVDKIGGKWCVAHPTYCRATAAAACSISSRVFSGHREKRRADSARAGGTCMARSTGLTRCL